MRNLVFSLLTLPLMAQSGGQHTYPAIHACGLTAHALFDGKPIGTLANPLRSVLLSTLKPQIALEAKAADVIDQNVQGTRQLYQSLLATELTSSRTGPRIFAVMWQESQICGVHENCAWWLLSEEDSHMNVIPQANPIQTGNSALMSQGGWATGLQKQPDGTDLLLMISSGYYSEGGRKANAFCMQLNHGKLFSAACAPNCDPDVEVNRPAGEEM